MFFGAEIGLRRKLSIEDGADRNVSNPAKLSEWAKPIAG